MKKYEKNVMTAKMKHDVYVEAPLIKHSLIMTK